MKIFLAGATGVIGKRLVPLLLGAGHEVVATTRTPDKLDSLRVEGAEAIVVNGLDEGAVIKAVVSAKPDVIVNEMTALTSMRSLKHFDTEFELTNRLRTAGTKYLLAAARAAGCRKLVVQSYTGWTNTRQGRVATEDDPLNSTPPKSMARTLWAIREQEKMVVNAAGMTGIVLRYGSFYGPGTSLSEDGAILKLVAQRGFPIVGTGSGVWSFIHIDDAARATLLAIERGTSGIYNIVDDDPAEASRWLPDLAQAIGARPPRHVPAWLGRVFIGEAGVWMMTQIQGSSNAKAKAALGWRLEYPSWHDGFRRGLSADQERRIA